MTQTCNNYYDTLVCILHSFYYSLASAAMQALFGLSLRKPLLNEFVDKVIYLYVIVCFSTKSNYASLGGVPEAYGSH